MYLVPAYQILAKELDDVIEQTVKFHSGKCHLVWFFEGSFEWQGHWASFCQVILQETCDSPKTPCKGVAGPSVFLSNMLFGWLNISESNVLAEVFHVHVFFLAFHCHHGSGSLVSFGKVGRFLEGFCIRSICGFLADNRGSIQKEVFWERKTLDKVRRQVSEDSG